MSMQTKKRIFITGGTGFFGKSMLDYRLRHPELANDEWTILSRNPAAFIKRYPSLAKQPGLKFREGDVRSFDFGSEQYDAVIHAATEAVKTLSDEEYALADYFTREPRELPTVGSAPRADRLTTDAK